MGATGTTAEAARAETAGVVLAGGRSRRMGQPKAALEIGGEPLLRRVIGRLRDALPGRVLVVGPAELAPLVPGVDIISDARPGAAGPLAGLEAALSYLAGLPGVPCRRAFVVACDMPLIAPALVRAMAVFAATEAGTAAAVTLRGERGPEPLHAVYSLSLLGDVTTLLDSGERSMRMLLAQVRLAEFPADMAAALDPAGLSAFNANTPEEWAAALALAMAERTRPQ